jgi:tetratricopeptide (TPR) repeat protein
MKKLIIIIFILGSAAVSYFYSNEIYRLHMKTYYTLIKGHDYKSMMKKANEMYTNNEYEKAHDFLKAIILIYNNRPEAARLMGMNMIKRGDMKGGVEVIVSSLDGGGVVDKRVIRETVVELYRQKLYGDIVDIAARNLHGEDYLVDFYYGVSLFYMKEYLKAIAVLNGAFAAGKGKFTSGLRSDLYYYMALSHEELGRLEEALRFLHRADKLSPSGKRTGEALVRIYRKLGDYRKAEKRLRKQKRLY